KPYVDYLDEKENELFKQFWVYYRSYFLLIFLHGGQAEGDLQTHVALLDQWHRELEQGAHQAVPWRTAYFTLQKALQAFSKDNAELYLSTMRSFHDLNRPLFGRYPNLRQHNGQQ